MKVCNNCGATLPDEVAFCNNCGASVQPVQPIVSQSAKKEPISVGGWIGRSLIPCIPLVGGIVYLIMLFVWSGDTKKEETFRNWAKAQLIVIAIVIVLAIIIGVICGVAAASVATSVMESIY